MKKQIFFVSAKEVFENQLHGSSEHPITEATLLNWSRWVVQLINKFSEFKMTRQATANRWSLSSLKVTVAARILFVNASVAASLVFGRTDGQTDIRREYDHLFGRGLVGQLQH